MIKKDLVIKNQIGLHARPAAMFVQRANRYEADIFVEKNTKNVNGKSIMGIMSLGVAKNESITIIIDGPDELEAMDDLTNLIEKVLLEY